MQVSRLIVSQRGQPSLLRVVHSMQYSANASAPPRSPREGTELPPGIVCTEATVTAVAASGHPAQLTIRIAAACSRLTLVAAPPQPSLPPLPAGWPPP